MPTPLRIRFSVDAAASLQEIFNHIRQQSPQNAGDVIERLIGTIDDLAFMPTRFKVVGRSRSTRHEVHACVEYPFIIYYRVDQSKATVFVIDVRHGARRQPRRFP
jgi:plasmid stabilization system protein ParE